MSTQTMNTKILKYAAYLAAAGILAAAALKGFQAEAHDGIIRNFWSPRAAGLGGVRLTTGLYEENFFGNPARAAANPIWQVQLMDIKAESQLSTIGTVAGAFSKKTDELLGELSSKSGQNNHFRLQLMPFALHFPNPKLSISFGVHTSVQADLNIQRNFNIDRTMVADVTIPLTVARKFLKDDALAVGATIHADYRVSASGDYSLVDFIQGVSISPLDSGGEGMHVDFDLGSTYVLPWKPAELELTTALVINNVIGGGYDTVELEVLGVSCAQAGGKCLPTAANRTLGLGFAARKKSLWKFNDLVAAFELTDIGNNGAGSFFRWIHMGVEAHWKILAARLGFNQGYPSIGAGVDFKAGTLDLAWYGEELSYNAGGRQDRRFALRLGFKI